MWNGTILERVQQYDYLGLTIQQNLKLESHIRKLIKNTQHKVYLFGKIRKFLSAKLAVLVLKTFILPKLEYGDIFLLGSKKQDVDKLQKLLNVCLRICFPSKNIISNVALHNMAKLLPLCYRRKISILKHMFKLSKDHNYVDNDAQRRGRSSATILLKTDRPKNERYLRSLFYEGPKLWRELPREIKNSENHLVFKDKLKKSILAEFNRDQVVYL